MDISSDHISFTPEDSHYHEALELLAKLIARAELKKHRENVYNPRRNIEDDRDSNERT